MTSRPVHGDVNTYKNGCRCSACREANRIYQNAANARRRNDPAGADRAGHGKRSTYVNWFCRCLLCRTASAEAQRAQRERRKERTQ
ncbi:hypothetical protein SAMN04490357_0989 [Streptomyces misionensis]|uniref:Uncharacterized protein n=1 Tax=Streptomyces misionensis TaxID=67331 RepID=A0A1H4P4P4_9ACTN|nr:hypothetical protein [Streptomyces misionensis]SEC02410.1 hypothetical protein SAMN04490357_0989 [Streptomyces misionensis]